MSSIRKPKCVTFRGHDQNDYKFLVKGGEDLRQDQRLEQVCNAIVMIWISLMFNVIILKTFFNSFGGLGENFFGHIFEFSDKIFWRILTYFFVFKTFWSLLTLFFSFIIISSRLFKVIFWKRYDFSQGSRSM